MVARRVKYGYTGWFVVAPCDDVVRCPLITLNVVLASENCGVRSRDFFHFDASDPTIKDK